MEMNRSRMIPGIALILFGLFLLLQQLGLIPGETFLIFLGAAFLVVYFITGRTGMLIPGCILAGLGIGITVLEQQLLEVPDYMPVFAGLSLGFLLICLLGWKKTGTWPLIPSFVILLFAFFIYGLETGFVQQNLRTYLELVIPAVLIVLGILMLIKSFSRPAK